MTFFLIPNIRKGRAFQTLREAAAVLRAHGGDVVVDESYSGHRGDFACMSAEDAWKACDIALTVGGDGTILHAAPEAMRHQKPILGVNVGRLGFLTVLEADQLDRLARIFSGEYHVEHRNLLSLHLPGGEESYALNDIVFFKQSPEKSISLDIYCDDTLVSSFRGDGVIFATPTGSTAYSMSAGGPIVDARLNSVVVTQICAHIVRMPPMVFAADRCLRIAYRGAPEEGVLIHCDGRQSYEMPRQQDVFVSHGTATVPLVQFDDADQLKYIDKKLKGR